MKELFNTLFGRENLTKAVKKNWLLKFASLFLAVVLWYYVGGEDRVDKNVMIPIEIINLPRDLVISSQFKKAIEVTVSGPRALILDLSNGGVTRQVDLSDATAGTMVIENRTNQIPVSRGITVQRVQPASIILSLDKLIHKEFVVAARTVGRVAKGYYLKSLRTDPSVITITGPRTILDPIDELATKAINLEGIKQSKELQIPLELDPTIVDLIGETSVTAALVVGLETVKMTIPDVKVHAFISGIEREVTPASVTVTADIPQLLLEKNSDPAELISVVAMQRGVGETLRVKVLPRPGDELPIGIISIIPSTVVLVDEKKNVSADLPEAESPVKEEAIATQKTQPAGADKSQDQSLPVPDPEKKKSKNKTK